MADTKISAFPAAAALGGTEAVPMVQTGADVKSTPAAINTYVRSTMGTGVSTAISVNVGSAGSFVVNGGALGTPSSGTLTSVTGLPEGGLALTDITTNDVSTSKHGFAPKAPNDATKYLDGTGAYSVPAGSGGTLLTLTAAPADLAYTGIIVNLTYGESMVPGDVGYIKSDGSFWKSDANVAGTFPVQGMAMETAASGTHVVLLKGIYRDDTRYNWTVGGALYLSTTAGSMTQTAPSAANDAIQVLGVATHADRVYFNPSPDYLTAGTLTIPESNVTFTDITTNNVSTTMHGYMVKLPNTATTYFDGTGAYVSALTPATVAAAGSAPQLSLGANSGTLGTIKLFGSTSGDVSIKPAVAAGTATVFQVPATNGNSGEFLQTNGSGVTVWAAASGGAVSGFILGMSPSWTSTTVLGATPGVVYIESLAGTISGAPADITPSSPSASTWYHIYVFSSSGTPTLEASTTAPVAFATPIGTARSKSGDTSRRYLYSARTNGSSLFYQFLAIGSGSDVQMRWIAQNVSASPFRFVNNVTANTAQTGDCSAVAPLTSRSIIVNIVNNASLAYAYFGSTTASATSYEVLVPDATVNAGNIGQRILTCSSTQTVSFFTGTGSGGVFMDLTGFWFAR